ncbi:MAG: PASTA domain-containing protein [Dysgonamonadaceae bacterium]|nr:PASTA domain-containing protein [Dysgonamonadaceae bacterium]
MNIIKNLLLAVAILFVLSLGTSIWLNVYTRHGESVEIPNVKTMSPEAAQPFFEARKLSYRVIDSTYNEAFVPGTIIETIPPAGSKVKKGRTIYLRINSHSAGTVLLPDLVDLSQRQAVSMLKSLGLEKIQIEWVPENYRDLVVGVEYRGALLQAGDKVPVSATVTLLVGSGTPAEEDETSPNEETTEDFDNPLDF